MTAVVPDDKTKRKTGGRCVASDLAPNVAFDGTMEIPSEYLETDVTGSISSLMFWMQKY